MPKALDAPAAVFAMLVQAATALYRAQYPHDEDHGPADCEDCRGHARAVLESLGLPLETLAALKAGTWAAVPRLASKEMLEMACVPFASQWEILIAAAPKYPEEDDA